MTSDDESILQLSHATFAHLARLEDPLPDRRSILEQQLAEIEVQLMRARRAVALAIGENDDTASA